MATITYLGYRIGDASQDKDRALSCKRTYMFSSMDATPMDILSHPEVPLIGSAYSGAYNNMRCVFRQTKHENEKGDFWEVECDYSAAMDLENVGGVTVNVTANPWDLAPEGIRFFPIPYERVLDKAYAHSSTEFTDPEGTPTVLVRTPSGSRYPDAPMVTYYNLGISFTYNVRFPDHKTPDVTKIINHVNKTKTTLFGLVYEPMTMLIKDLSFEYMLVRTSAGKIDRNRCYWKADITLEIDAAPWNGLKHSLRVDAFDYYCLSGGACVPIYRNKDPESAKYGMVGPLNTVKVASDGSDCEKIETPWPLNADGTISVVPNSGAKKPGIPAVTTYYPYYYLEFKVLQLPEKRVEQYD